MSGQKPSIGRIVVYRSRTGKLMPAVIAATLDTLDPEGRLLYDESGGTRGMPPLSTARHVHLVVLTPGLPGAYEPPPPRSEPGAHVASPEGNTFGEWNVPYEDDRPTAEDGEQPPATWRWPERV